MKIDVSLIVNVIAQTLQSTSGSYQKRLLDIGVFRFSDAARPYIQVRPVLDSRSFGANNE